MSRGSITNRGSNLISAMNPMEDRLEGDSRLAEADKLLDGESLQTVSPPMKPIVSKIILVSLSVAAIAALVTLIVILATKKSDTTEATVRPCTFYAPYTNWVNYGLNGTNVTCPIKGSNYTCKLLADCLAISHLCVPGSRSALSCVANTCQVISQSMPTLDTDGGLCAVNSERPVCAKCTGHNCGSGVALCVTSSDCSSKSYLECHSDGHDFSQDL